MIPEILIKELSSFDLSNPDHLLFTPDGAPGNWATEEPNRRDYFSARYGRVKKALGFGVEYNIYSFRHTVTIKLYKELRKQYHISETLDRLMLITGHESVSGLKNYLRSIDAELPEDWSELLK